MTFSVIAASDIPQTSNRVTKTTPLRKALACLQIGEAIEVAYDTFDEEAGYKPTTITQVASTMTAKSETVRFSVKRKADLSGCYMVATAKPEPGTTTPRGRKPKPVAEVVAA